MKESDDVPAGTDTGVKPGVELTPPGSVLTQVTPHVTSKLRNGLVADVPTIRTTTLTLVVNELDTIAVQLCVLELFARLRWCVQWSFAPVNCGAGRTVN